MRRLRFITLICLALSLTAVSRGEAGQIVLTDVPPYGVDAALSGTVSGVVGDDFRVLVYIYVSGWWNKPTWSRPLTVIDGDGNWTCDITTGGDSDTLATQIIAFLIPADAYLPSWEMAGQAQLPVELYDYPHARATRDPAARTIAFAGHTWSVKSGFHGPGPNAFSDSTDNVWVDAGGKLHLKIIFRDGQWTCSEIISAESFGYGTYVFTVDSRLDEVDQNIVLGLFTWDSFAPQYHYREIDFEFSRWGVPGNDIGQYVIQPWDTAGNLYRFEMDYAGHGAASTHVMTWRPSGIYFKSYFGALNLAPPPEMLIRDWIYTGADNPPAGGENVRMNLWLISGRPPADGLDREVVISDFQFLSGVSNLPGDIDDDGRVNLADFAHLAFSWQQTGCDALNRWCGEADLTGSGCVDADDLFAWLRCWLQNAD